MRITATGWSTTTLSDISVHEATLGAIAAADSTVQLWRPGVAGGLLEQFVLPKVIQYVPTVIVFHVDVIRKRC
jgi:hypothetical protein